MGENRCAKLVAELLHGPLTVQGLQKDAPFHRFTRDSILAFFSDAGWLVAPGRAGGYISAPRPTPSTIGHRLLLGCLTMQGWRCRRGQPQGDLCGGIAQFCKDSMLPIISSMDEMCFSSGSFACPAFPLVPAGCLSVIF